jgi:arginyl-tRNA--protein-N-Asp/Glu arginylyltransferase
MSDMSLIYCNAFAEVEKHEEGYALDNGWAVDEWCKQAPRIWFQARQTRLRVSEFKNNKKVRKILNRCPNITTKVRRLNEIDNINELEKIYRTFVNYKEFSEDLGALSIENEIDKDKKIIFEYYDAEILRAFTIARLYDGTKSMTGVSFCWDYHNPKLYLGKYSVMKELEYARDNELEYCYQLPGYEKTCVYKMNLPGFEFWDGQKWSKNKEAYESMCNKDDEIKTTKDMNELMWRYEKEYFKTH